MEFTPHSKKQEDAIFSRADITACVTGIQYGKTTIGAWWMRVATHEYTQKRDNFIIAAPTYKIMQQSSLPEFKRVFAGCGKYHKVDQVFEIYGGGTIYFRTGTEPDSVVGITNVKSIWGDEAGKYSKYFWENLEGRAAFAGARIMLTTTPYSLNWLYTDLVKPSREGKRGDINLIAGRSIENPYFNREVYFKRKKTMDPRAFRAMYEGSFERMQGLVYDCFNENEHVIDKFEHRTGTKYYAGIDWGFNDPFCILIIAVTPDGTHILISETYKASLTPPEVTTLIAQKYKIFGFDVGLADPSQPGYISQMQGEGIPIVQGENDLLLGIGLVIELIKSGKFKVLRGTAPNTLDEFSTYHWPEPKHLLPDQNAKKDVPVDQNNHAMDSLRYLRCHTWGIEKLTTPMVPGEERVVGDNPERRIKKLLRRTQQTYERFS